MTTLWVDFETRSACDLKKHGVYNYAMDPTTEVLCMCYAFDDDPVETWVATHNPSINDLLRNPVPDRVRDFKGQIRAHNAAFERLIFQHVLGLEFDDEQFYCTATQARANCMPGALGDVARFCGVDQKKDYRGAQLIRWLCIPRPDGTFNDDPQLMQELFDYCAQDVRAMRAASKSMRDLTAEELLDYHVNERINDIGVRIDIPLCDAAVKYAAQETQDIEDSVVELTDGEVTSVRSRNMCQWVYDRVGPQAKQLMESYNDGEKKISIDKSTRFNLLALADADPDEIPARVAEVIQCADNIWASSVAKFKRFAEVADFDDDRARGAFVFAGASSTGRDTSYALQLHNIPRKASKIAEEIREAMVKGEPLVPKYGRSVSAVLKQMLRPALIPAPGHVFIVSDWSAIEGRVNPWLVNSPSGEAKLDVYRDGLDPYILNAAPFYNMSYEEIHDGHEAKVQKYTDIRQAGKVMELALGFCAGAGTFDQMSKVYNIKFTKEQVEKAITLWRRNNPWAFEHGKALESAAKRAMRHPGHEFMGGRTTYMFDGTHLWYHLPSGKILCYPFARLEDGSVSYANAAWKPKANASEWPRDVLWMGKYANNVTQATANDLLRYARRELDDLYYRIVAHTHDEIVVEVPKEEAKQARAEIEMIMTTPPSWAEGLPLAVESSTLTRYGK